MGKKINQDVVSRFLTRTQSSVQVEESQKVDKVIHNEAESKIKDKQIIRQSINASNVSNSSRFEEKQKVLRTYNVPKSLYLDFMKSKLSKGDISRDVSSIIRDELEEFLADYLNGSSHTQRELVVPRKTLQKCDMVNKGFYLTLNLIDAIKIYSFINQTRDSDVIRKVMSNYIQKNENCSF